MANSLPLANRDHVARNHGHSDSHGVFPQDPLPFFAETCVSEIANKLQQLKFHRYPENRSINIEVIDDTALINTSLVGKFNRKRRGEKGRKRNKKKIATVGRKDQLVYSRAELEALRFQNSDDQKKKWAEVYDGLGPVVAAEYDGLVTSADINKNSGGPTSRFAPRPFPLK